MSFKLSHWCSLLGINCPKHSCQKPSGMSKRAYSGMGFGSQNSQAINSLRLSAVASSRYTQGWQG